MFCCIQHKAFFLLFFFFGSRILYSIIWGILFCEAALSKLYQQYNGITFLPCTPTNLGLEVTLVGCSSEFLKWCCATTMLVFKLLDRPCLPCELQSSYSSYYFISGCKIDKLLASSPPQLQQITVRMLEGCQGWSWRTGKKFLLLLDVKRWGTNWKVTILLSISSSLPSLPTPPLFYVRSSDKNICRYCFKYVVGKFSF